MENSKRAAQTKRALRRVSEKCVKSEEVEVFFRSLLREGVGVPTDEEFLLSEEGRRKSGSMGEKGLNDLRNILTRRKLNDCRKLGREHRKARGKLRRELKEVLCVSQAKAHISKVKKHCDVVRERERKAYKKRVTWLTKKYKK